MEDSHLSAFIEQSLQSSKDTISCGKELLPQVFFFARERGAPALFPVFGMDNLFQSIEGKRKLRPFVKAVWAQAAAGKPYMELIAVLLLMDTWIEDVTPQEFEDMKRNGRRLPFSPKPGMAEAVFVQISMADREIHYKWPYVRGDEGVVFASKPKINDVPPSAPKAMVMGLWPL